MSEIILRDGSRAPGSTTCDAVVAAARTLEASGCLVEEVLPPDVSQATEIFFGMMAADGGARARIDLAAAGGRHTRQMQSLLADLAARALDTVGYFVLFRRWAALRTTVRTFVAAYDVVLAPVTVGAAPFHGCIPGTAAPLESYDAFNFTHAFSVAGLPVAVLPIAHGRRTAPGCPDRRQSVPRPDRPRRRHAPRSRTTRSDGRPRCPPQSPRP